MHCCRFTTESSDRSVLGRVDRENETVVALDVDEPSLDAALRRGTNVAEAPTTDETYDLAAVTLRAPVERPTNLLGIGLNYAGHAAEGGFDVPEEPVFFAKSPSSIADPYGEIVRHDLVTDLHYEGEFAVVVGDRLRAADPDSVREGIFGYVAANDVTARDLQARDLDDALPWFRAKSMDTFTPLGPWVATADEVAAGDVGIETRLNGETVQDARTDDLIFDVAEALSAVSQYVTLQPGDVVLTGTPAGIGSMEPGDEIAVEIEGIGTLRNAVVAPE
ncbi:MAG: fumarylacetoacetate hydrolase family protein [Natronomonas sp.]|uniref:fumarylacetoacetate hydrolase family protein n=1 Tax=Natronomonas sp. TaxID=2184060 RepID=UPI0028708445|nr:fumarylacetoacetate hydrolase family protein [Natronomonas sp.]MDR9431987.1 fumarylacetoacetate hydrolase family protein [Natronomonas sp.]